MNSAGVSPLFRKLHKQVYSCANWWYSIWLPHFSERLMYGVDMLGHFQREGLNARHRHSLHFSISFINKALYCYFLNPSVAEKNHRCLKSLLWLCLSEVPTTTAVLLRLESTISDQKDILLSFWLIFFCCIINYSSQDTSHLSGKWSQSMTDTWFSQQFSLKLSNRWGVTKMPVLNRKIVQFRTDVTFAVCFQLYFSLLL